MGTAEVDVPSLSDASITLLVASVENDLEEAFTIVHDDLLARSNIFWMRASPAAVAA